MKKEFPEMITQLPEADISLDGLSSYLIQGEDQQVLFMSFDEDVIVDEHSHEAQWGVVLSGVIEMTIEGKTVTYTQGDSYYIPKDAVHSARISKGYKDVTVFNQKDRYRVAEI